MKKILFGMGLYLALGCVQSGAQDVTEEICLSVGRIYKPSVDEVKSIRLVPVSEDFESAYQNQNYCYGYIHLEKTLVLTHLKYGDERSISAALSFLETEIRNKTLSVREVKRIAKRRAQLLSKVTAIDEKYKTAYSSPDNRPSPEARKVFSDKINAARSELQTTEPSYQQLYALIADLYLKAAEFYNSAKFIDKAVEFTAAYKERLSIYSKAKTKTAYDRTHDNQYRLRHEFITLRNLEERIAVSRALHSRNPKDIVAARALLKSRYNRAYDIIAAYSIGEVCDFDIDDLGVPKTVQEKIADNPFFQGDGCDGKDSVEHSVRSYWYRMAMLETPEAANSGQELNKYITMASIYKAANSSDLYIYRYNDPRLEAVRLMLLAAESEDNSQNKTRILVDAMTWFQPFEQPALWRQVAEAYLLHARPDDWDFVPQQHSYVQKTLDNLDAISIGE